MTFPYIYSNVVTNRMLRFVTKMHLKDIFCVYFDLFLVLCSGGKGDRSHQGFFQYYIEFRLFKIRF